MICAHLFLSLPTGLLVLLVVDVWFFWSRSITCCREVRDFLGCPGEPTDACFSFQGDCADLPGQYAGVVNSGIPAEWTFDSCSAFPDPVRD